MAQKGGPCYRGQARLSTTSQALRASSPSRGASGETVHFAGTAKASPTRRGGIASAMTERLYEDRADGSRAVSTKKEDPLSELQLREGVFFLVSQMTSSISTFTIYSICHSPQKSSFAQKVYRAGFAAEGRPVLVQPLSLAPFDSSPSRGASGETVHLAGTAKASPTRSNGDDRRQWRKQGGAVGAAASRMRAAAKQTLGAATRAVASRQR